MASLARKNLIKLLKIIHPDILASCGQQTAFKVAQKVNLACIQNFQQLWDCFDPILIKSAMQTNHVQLIALRKPLEKKYELTFYFTRLSSSDASSSSSSTTSLFKVPYTMRTPQILTKAHDSIPFKDAHTAVKMILKHHDSIYSAAGLPTNWLTIVPGFESDEREKESDDIFDDEDALRRLERLCFDKMVTEHDRQRRLRSLAVRDFSSAFQFSVSSRNPRNRLESEINYYLKNGNLRFHKVAVEDELDAIRRMKEFFLNYGLLVKFGLLDWHEVRSSFAHEVIAVVTSGLLTIYRWSSSSCPEALTQLG